MFVSWRHISELQDITRNRHTGSTLLCFVVVKYRPMLSDTLQIYFINTGDVSLSTSEAIPQHSSMTPKFFKPTVMTTNFLVMFQSKFHFYVNTKGPHTIWIIYVRQWTVFKLVIEIVFPLGHVTCQSNFRWKVTSWVFEFWMKWTYHHFKLAVEEILF